MRLQTKRFETHSVFFLSISQIKLVQAHFSQRVKHVAMLRVLKTRPPTESRLSLSRKDVYDIFENRYGFSELSGL